MSSLWKTENLLQTGTTLLRIWKKQLAEMLVVTAIVGIAAFVTLASATAGSHLVASAAHAALTADQTFALGARTVTVHAGSSMTSLSNDASSFTVVLAADESATFSMDLLSMPGRFASGDSTIDTCEFYEHRNFLTLNGPRTVTITPDTNTCDSSYGNAEIVKFTQGPTAGQALQDGASQLILWQSFGSVSRIRIRLSVDGGLTFPTVLATDLTNNGAYVWTVPLIPTTTHARLKIEALGLQDAVLAFAVTDADFTINGTAPVVVPPPVVTPPAPALHSFDPSAATAAATTIGDDKALQQADLAHGTVTCVADTRIKGTTSSAVYYCGRDGKRHAFPNQRVHDTWYSGFNGVVTLTDAQLANIPLGSTVTYRPGVRLVKITTDPKTYAVDAHGVLRWIKSEAAAKDLYGNDWNKKVDDIPDAFFTDYTVGADIE